MSEAYISMELDDVQEAEVAPDGMYDLRVSDAELTRNRDDTRDMIKVVIELEGTTFQPCWTNLPLPNEDDKPSSANFMKLQLKRFIQMFDAPFDGVINDELMADWCGLQARGAVKKVKTINDNDMSELQLPKLK